MPPENPEVARRPFAALVLAIGSALLIWGLLVLLDSLRLVAFLGFLALVLSTILRYPVALFSRVMSRGLATALTFVLLLAALAGLGWRVVPPVLAQAEVFEGQVPATINRIEASWNETTQNGVLQRLHDPRVFEQLRQWMVGQAERFAGKALSLVWDLFGALSGALLVVVLAHFFAYQPGDYVQGLQRLVPKRHETAAGKAAQQVAGALRSWALGTLLAMAIVGVLASVAMVAVGVKTWMLVGAVAFVAEFVPFFGPLAAGVVAVVAGLAQSPRIALWALAAYAAVQLVEGHLVQPLVMRRALRVAPGVLILWQLAFTATFGFMGLLVATPLLGAVRAAVEYLYVERTLGKASPQGEPSHRPPP